MKTSLYVLSILAFVLTAARVSAQSQECKTNAENKIGEFVRIKAVAPRGALSPATFKYVKNEMAIVDTIGNLFMKIDPKPIGSHAEWCAVFVPTDSITCPDHTLANYLYDASYQPYICDNGKVVPYIKANLWVSASINDTYSAGITRLNDSLFTLPPRRGTMGGYPMFFPDPGHYQREYYSVLIHHPGKLPYKPVSKGELLDLSLKIVDVEEANFFKIVEMDVARGAERNTDNEERMRNNYRIMRENIQAQRKLNEKTLSQPAIILQSGWAYGSIYNMTATSRIFTTPNRGFQVVQPNPDYVDNTKEKWKPQYIWLSWRKSLEDFNPRNTHVFDSVMREKFDFSALGKLLTY